MSATFLTPPEIAKRLRIRPSKVLAWIQSGELAALNIAEKANGKRPRYRVATEALKAFHASRRVIPAPAPPAPPAPRKRGPARLEEFV
jgi:excisionase family DNA binding protein